MEDKVLFFIWSVIIINEEKDTSTILKIKVKIVFFWQVTYPTKKLQDLNIHLHGLLTVEQG